MQDAVLVQFVTKGLPPDSPEFQARANRPLSEHGPNLAQLREQQKADATRDQASGSKPEGEQPAA